MRGSLRRPTGLVVLTMLLLVTLAVPLSASVARPFAQTTVQLPLVLNERKPLLRGVHISIADWSDKAGITVLTQLDKAAEVGAQLIRLPVSWNLFEERWNNDYRLWYTERLLEILDRARQHNIGVLIMMEDPPAWAVNRSEPGCDDGRDHWCAPRDVNDYAQAVHELIRRLATPERRGTIRGFEVWNEPNYRGDTGGTALTPAQYATLLKVTYRAVKPSYPWLPILGGSIAGTDTSYLSQLYEAGIKGHFDILSIHPYTKENTRTPDDCSDPAWSYRCGVEGIRAIMVGDQWQDERPIWFTEFGWSSYVGDQGVGKEAQAAYLRRAIGLIGERRWDYVEAAIWYNLIDCTEYGETTCLNGPQSYHPAFGLLHQGLTPKPAALELRNAPLYPPPGEKPPEAPISLTIQGDAEAGLHVLVPRAGRYVLTITGGAYSPWPQANSPNDQWRSVLNIYRNRAIDWIDKGYGYEPGAPDHSLGVWEVASESQESAEARGTGQSLSLELDAGTHLVIVPTDVRGGYLGNRGEVRLSLQQLAGPVDHLPSPFLLWVAGDLQSGIPIVVASTATMTMTITGDVYSPWAEDNGPNDQWRSVLFFYHNRSVMWEDKGYGSEPGSPDFHIGYWEQSGESRAAAETRAMGEQATRYLQAGDRVIVIPIDVQGSYAWNRGGVALGLVIDP